MKLNEGKLSLNYSKPFQILSEAVRETNCSKVGKLEGILPKTFEHHKILNPQGEKGGIDPTRPMWLPG